jgi:hypothetical protein
MSRLAADGERDVRASALLPEARWLSTRWIPG